MPEARAIVADKDIRPGLNNGVAAIGKNLFVAQDPAVLDGVALPAAGARVYGATMEVIPPPPTGGDALQPANRGDVQIDGRAVVLSGAAVAAGVNVASDAAGKAVLAALGNIIAGVTMTAATAADQLIEVELAGPAGAGVSP